MHAALPLLLLPGLIFLLLTFLPGFIAIRRNAQNAVGIGRLAILAIAIASIGFLWVLLGDFSASPRSLILGLLPGTLLWFVALIWACLDRRPHITRGFEIQPLHPSGDQTR